jgi:hypothetical protein
LDPEVAIQKALQDSIVEFESTKLSQAALEAEEEAQVQAAIELLKGERHDDVKEQVSLFN